MFCANSSHLPSRVHPFDHHFRNLIRLRSHVSPFHTIDLFLYPLKHMKPIRFLMFPELWQEKNGVKWVNLIKAQRTFTCSKLTTKVRNMFKVSNKDTRTMVFTRLLRYTYPTMMNVSAVILRLKTQKYIYRSEDFV